MSRKRVAKVKGPLCHQHGKNREWQLTTFEYNEDGIFVQVKNIYAWVCPEDGDASFTPEISRELFQTIREMVEVAKRTRAKKSQLQYNISVG